MPTKNVHLHIPSWTLIVTALIFVLGFNIPRLQATGRFNLPLSWILTPSGTAVDANNDGVIDNSDELDGNQATAFQMDLNNDSCTDYYTSISQDGTVSCGSDDYAADDQDIWTSSDPSGGGSTTIDISNGSGATFHDDYAGCSSCDGVFLNEGSRGACRWVCVRNYSGVSCSGDEYMAGYEPDGSEGVHCTARDKHGIYCCDRE